MEGIPKFLRVDDLMEILSISESKAYSIIRNLNQKLKEQGYETLAGRVPTKFFCENFYCGEEMLTETIIPGRSKTHGTAKTRTSR